MNFILTIIFVAQTFASEGFYRIEKAPSEVKKVAKSVVRIDQGDGARATGFYVAKNLILTNHHVIKKCLNKLGLDPFGIVRKRHTFPCPNYKIRDINNNILDENVFLYKVPKIIKPEEYILDAAFDNFYVLEKKFNEISTLWADYALVWVLQKGEPVEFDFFDVNYPGTLYNLGFPRKLNRKKEDRKIYFTDLAAKNSNYNDQIILFKNMAKKEKIINCQQHYSDSQLWAKKGLVRKILEGDFQACEQHINYKMYLLKNKIRENVRIKGHLLSLPLVNPNKYDMPDANFRWSKGHIVREVTYLDWGRFPIGSYEIPAELGFLQNIDEDHGNSGGPIVNTDGKVVGLVSRSATKEFKYGLYGEFNFSISSHRLIEFIK